MCTRDVSDGFEDRTGISPHAHLLTLLYVILLVLLVEYSSVMFYVVR